MIAKLPYLRPCRNILIRAHLRLYVSSVSGLQTNPQNDQNPPNSSQFDAKIQSLKNKLHPETLINVLSSTHDLNSSLRLFKWASLQNQFKHTIDTYLHIIMKLGMASRVDEMEGFCNEMVKGGYLGTEQALLKVLDSFITYHRVDEALRVFLVVKSFHYKHSIGLINRLLSALVEEKKGIKSILFVYKEMVKAGTVPTTETLNYILAALFDADRVDSVVDQYKRMKKKGCFPNSRTYEIMVSGLIFKNHTDEALVVLNEILENGRDLQPEFFNLVLPLLFKFNKHDMGLRLFEKMKTCKVVPDLSVYEVLIRYYSKNLFIDNAIKLFNEMLGIIDLTPSDCVFVDLVDGFCMLNKLSEAKQFLEDHHVTEANSYNTLLKGYCQSDNFVEVIWLFQKMVERNITNCLSWNILIRYLSENQRNDLLCKSLSRMIVSASIPDSTTYSALIIGKCKSNEDDDALNLFHHVREEKWVVDSSCYATLIESLCQMDKVQEAVEVFHYMSSNKCMLSASSFRILIRGLCLKGKVNKVINLLPLACCLGLFCSKEDYSIIMKSVSKFNNGNDILVIVARMIVEGCPLDLEAYNEIIKSMSEHHRVIECALFLNRMVNEGMYPYKDILADSLSYLAQMFKLHMVLPTIHKLFSVSDPEVFNPITCNILINGLWKEGYKYEARWLLDMMLEKGWVPDSTTHRLLVNSGACEVSAYKIGDTQDEIISILSEGFGEV